MDIMHINVYLLILYSITNKIHYSDDREFIQNCDNNIYDNGSK